MVAAPIEGIAGIGGPSGVPLAVPLISSLGIPPPPPEGRPPPQEEEGMSQREKDFLFLLLLYLDHKKTTTTSTTGSSNPFQGTLNALLEDLNLSNTMKTTTTTGSNNISNNTTTTGSNVTTTNMEIMSTKEGGKGRGNRNSNLRKEEGGGGGHHQNQNQRHLDVDDVDDVDQDILIEEEEEKEDSNLLHLGGKVRNQDHQNHHFPPTTTTMGLEKNINGVMNDHHHQNQNHDDHHVPNSSSSFTNSNSNPSPNSSSSSVLPQMVDWKGSIRNSTFQEIKHLYAHLSPLHILDLLERGGPTPDSTHPSTLTSTSYQTLLLPSSSSTTTSSSFLPRANSSSTVAGGASSTSSLPALLPSSLPHLSLPSSSHSFLPSTIQKRVGTGAGGSISLLAGMKETYMKTLNISHTLLSPFGPLPSSRGNSGMETRGNLTRLWHRGPESPSNSTSPSRHSCHIHPSRLTKLTSLHGHLAPIYSMAFDFTGNRFFTGADDNLVKVWDGKTGWLIRTLRAHTSKRNESGLIVDLTLDTTNQLLATTSTDKQVRIWCLRSFEPLDCISIGKAVSTISFSPFIPGDSGPETPVINKKGKGPLFPSNSQVTPPNILGTIQRKSQTDTTDGCYSLVVLCNDCKVRIYRSTGVKGVFEKNPIILTSGTLIRDQVACVSFDKSGTKFASGGDDGIIYLHSLPLSQKKGSPPPTTLFHFPQSHTAPVADVAISGCGRYMVSGCKHGVVAVYTYFPPTRDEETGEIVEKGDKGEWRVKTWSVDAFSREEMPRYRREQAALAEAAAKDDVEIVAVVERVATPPPPSPLVPPPSASMAAADVAAREILTTALMEQNINEALRESSILFQQNSGTASNIDVIREASSSNRPDSAPSGTGETITITPSRSRHARATSSYQPHSVSRYLIAPPLTPNAPSTTQTNIHPEMKPVEILETRWNITSTLVITSSTDHVVRIWYPDGQHLHSLFGHTADIDNVLTHPINANLLLTAGLDGNIFMWDIRRGKKVFSDSVGSGLEAINAVFSPDGERFLVSDNRGVVHIFGLSPDKEAYEKTPFQQFHELDWRQVREDQEGNLLDDVAGGIPAHLVEMGPVCSLHRVPYPMTTDQLVTKTSDHIVSNYLVEAEFGERQRLLEFARRDMPKDLAANAQVDKKQLLKRRKQIVIDPDSENHQGARQRGVMGIGFADAFNAPLPLPYSSGDEYSGAAESMDDAVSEESGDLFAEGSNVLESYFDDHSGPYYENDGTVRRNGSRKAKKRYPIKRTRARDNSDSDSMHNFISLRDEDVQRRKRPKRSANNSRAPHLRLSDDEMLDEDVDFDNIMASRRAARPRAFTKRYEAPKWISATTHNYTPYLPQLRDLIVYIKQGHKTFAALTGQNVEEIVDQSLPEVVLCRVISLNYTPGEIIKCELELAQYPTLEEPEGGADEELPTMKILFHDADDVPDFLILWEDYVQSTTNEWKVGDTVVARYSEGEYEAIISEIVDNDSPWERYQIKYQDDDGMEKAINISPWELRHPEGNWAIVPTMKRRDIIRVAAILSDLSENPNVEPFMTPVDYKYFPTYLVHVAYPMYIGLIQERFKNGFYRCLEHLLWEWNLICADVNLYNEPNSEISRLAERFVRPVAEKLSGVVGSGQTLSNVNSAESLNMAGDGGSSSQSNVRRYPKLTIKMQRPPVPPAQEVAPSEGGDYNSRDASSSEEEDEREEIPRQHARDHQRGYPHQHQQYTNEYGYATNRETRSSSGRVIRPTMLNTSSRHRRVGSRRETRRSAALAAANFCEITTTDDSDNENRRVGRGRERPAISYNEDYEDEEELEQMNSRASRRRYSDEGGGGRPSRRVAVRNIQYTEVNPLELERMEERERQYRERQRNHRGNDSQGTNSTGSSRSNSRVTRSSVDRGTASAKDEGEEGAPFVHVNTITAPPTTTRESRRKTSNPQIYSSNNNTREGGRRRDSLPTLVVRPLRETRSTFNPNIEAKVEPLASASSSGNNASIIIRLPKGPQPLAPNNPAALPPRPPPSSSIRNQQPIAIVTTKGAEETEDEVLSEVESEDEVLTEQEDEEEDDDEQPKVVPGRVTTRRGNARISPVSPVKQVSTRSSLRSANNSSQNSRTTTTSSKSKSKKGKKKQTQKNTRRTSTRSSQRRRDSSSDEGEESGSGSNSESSGGDSSDFV